MCGMNHDLTAWGSPYSVANEILAFFGKKSQIVRTSSEKRNCGCRKKLMRMIGCIHFLNKQRQVFILFALYAFPFQNRHGQTPGPGYRENRHCRGPAFGSVEPVFGRSFPERKPLRAHLTYNGLPGRCQAIWKIAVRGRFFVAKPAKRCYPNRVFPDSFFGN